MSALPNESFTVDGRDDARADRHALDRAHEAGNVLRVVDDDRHRAGLVEAARAEQLAGRAVVGGERDVDRARRLDARTPLPLITTVRSVEVAFSGVANFTVGVARKSPVTETDLEVVPDGVLTHFALEPPRGRRRRRGAASCRPRGRGWRRRRRSGRGFCARDHFRKTKGADQSDPSAFAQADSGLDLLSIHRFGPR